MALTTKTTLRNTSSVGPTGDHGLQILVIDRVSVAVHAFPASGTAIIGRSSSADVVIDDPRLSRRHLEVSAEPLMVTDLGSANGTIVRDRQIPAHARLGIATGDSIHVGSASIVVQRVEDAGVQTGVRRLYRHAYFEGRLQDECLRARATGLPFALVRLALPKTASWAVVAPVLASLFPPPHLFASYGPHDYEAVLIGADLAAAQQTLQAAQKHFAELGFDSRQGVAIYPGDGKDFQSLIGAASSRLRETTPVAAAPMPQQLSEAMQSVLTTAVRVSATTINVMILGETGVGKEILARRIHRLSRRASGPFVAINCGALNSGILETELFGSERGAFTGATTKKGLVESASGGTLFLDELGDMPTAMQVKLLRVLQENELTRVGAVDARQVDIRIVSATNQDIESAVRAGSFRSDLYYRLNGVVISVPPLRQRRAEIQSLAETFIAEFVRDEPRPSLDPATLKLLERHDWPGNIRELRNVVERACVLAEGPRLLPQHVPAQWVSGVDAG
jgi:hypothetical protein